MSAPHPAAALLGTRATVDAALRGIDASAARARALLDGVIALARQDAALALRLAMVLAWVKRHDLSELGYPSFGAFCRERVGWGDSWLRDLVRLVESPLDLVKAAACQGLVPLRVAVKAPGHVAVDGQADWLLDPESPPAPGRPLERFEGDDAVVVQRARRLARLCIGRAASAVEVDDYILAWWRDRVPAEALLASAHERPEKPAFDVLAWDWVAGGDPAEALVGPWTVPHSLGEAVERVAALQALRAGRATVLARTWAMADFHALWAEAGFESADQFTREALGWSGRTARRNKRLGWALQLHPELDRAIEDGLDPGSIALLAGVIGEPTAARWVAVARRVGRLELARAVAEARTDRHALGRYERAIALADRWQSEEARPSAGGPEGHSAGGPEGRPRAGGPDVLVAFPHADVPRPEVSVRGPRELPTASRWFVEHVAIEPQRGFGKVKERDGYRCQNPECGRESLRNEAHHIHPRSLGGSDDLDNGVTVCRVCHLRGLHANGGLSVDRVVVEGVEALWWRYPGGRSVLQFRRAIQIGRPARSSGA